MATIDKAMIYKKDLSAYEKKWFDSLRAEYPNEDLALIAEAAKEQGRIHKIQEENAKRAIQIAENERKREEERRRREAEEAAQNGNTPASADEPATDDSDNSDNTEE